MTEIAARARIHRRDQLEARRKIGLPGRARDRNAPRFQRFAQDFEYGALELRQFIQKKHAVMRERDFAGTRRATAADQCHAGRSVVRRRYGRMRQLLALKPLVSDCTAADSSASASVIGGRMPAKRAASMD